MLSRRTVLAASCAGLVAGPVRAGELDRAEWDAFKSRFLQPDGRVVDSGNQGVSHTEGQGWGLLFAEHCGDQAAFASIWGWTARNLHRPRDALHSWRFDPGSTTPVADPNNATDGDLFIGMALSRAARRWDNAAYGGSATAIGHDVLRLLVKQVGGRSLLLPGTQGFSSEKDLVLNPSYYVFPALQELSPRVRSPLWDAVRRDGAALIAEARFGRWKLPPDWLQLNRSSGKLAPAPSWPPRFSYDAIRVPLYLAWSRLTPLAGFQDYMAGNGAKPPAWVDLVTNESAPYPAPPGMLAVASLANAGAARDLPADFPLVAAAPDYYSAALTLLARIAWRESRD